MRYVIRGDFVGLLKAIRVRKQQAAIASIQPPIKPTHPVAVILPVYRGIEMTKRCILAAMP